MITIEEVADFISEGLPDWQREVNLAWLRQLHNLLQEGGVWGCPALGCVYQKKGEGFESIVVEE